MANTEWISLFSDVKAQHLVHSFSDHCPILIDTKKETRRQNENIFRIENWWFLEDLFVAEAEQLWKMTPGNFLQKTKILMKGLENWAGKIQNKKNRKKKLLTTKLSELLDAERDDINMEEMIDTKIQLNMEFEKEERYWEQRAQLNWLKLGDKNIAIFHSQATQRQRKNKIRRLQNAHGKDTKDPQEIEEIARSYFQNLFASENQENLDYLLLGIGRCIYEEENKKLTAQ